MWYTVIREVIVNDSLRTKRLAELQGKTFESTGRHATWLLTGAEVVAFYEAIVRRDLEPYKALGCDGMSDRKADRAVQILKSRGLVAFDKKARAWKAT